MYTFHQQQDCSIEAAVLLALIYTAAADLGLQFATLGLGVGSGITKGANLMKLIFIRIEVELCTQELVFRR